MLLAALLAAVPAVAQVAPPAPTGSLPGAEPVVPQPGEAVALSLPEAVALGLRQNRSIRSAYLNRVVQKFNLLVAEERFVPTVSLNVGTQRDWDSVREGDSTTTDSVSVRPRVTWALPTGGSIEGGYSVAETMRRSAASVRNGASTWTITLTQPLLSGGGLDVGMAPVRQARLAEQDNVLALKGTVSDTVTSIIRAYYSFILAHRQTTIARNGLDRARSLLEVNRALIAAGRMAENEIFQTESNVANQELSVLDAENAFETARLALTTLLALSPAVTIIPAEEIRAEPVRMDLDVAQDLAFQNRPDYLSQVIGLEQARINVMLAENAALWDLNLTVGTTINQNGSSASHAARAKADSAGSSIGLNLTIPLRDRTAQAGTLSAKVSLQQAELTLEQTREQVGQQIRDAVRDVGIRWRQLELAQRARGLAEQSLDVEMIKLRNGRTTNFQVLSIENDLRAAETAELAAVISYLNALATLDQQLGTTLDTWSISLND